MTADNDNGVSEYIDKVTFSQIQEMDDDGDHEFSCSILFDFFDQAETSFGDMQDALEKKDLANLSSLGHFLKGSAATLGLIKVKDHCEKIQHLGEMKDETGMREVNDAQLCLDKIAEILKALRVDYDESVQKLKILGYDRETQSFTEPPNSNNTD